MPNIDVAQWQAIGVVCGALVAALTLLRLLYTKVARPMFRGARRTYKRVNQVVDLFLGDKERGLPSLPDQVRDLKVKLGEHVAEYHARPNGAGAAHARVVGRRQ